MTRSTNAKFLRTIWPQGSAVMGEVAALRVNAWASALGDAKMTTALRDHHTHRSHIFETSNDSYRFKASSETAKENARKRQHEGIMKC